MFAAILLLAAASEALPSQAQLEVALGDAVHAACPKLHLNTDPDLRRACRAYVDAAARGTAAVSGGAVSFYASLESYEPSPIAGVAKVVPASTADRALGQLFPPGCHFNRAGVAAAILPGGEAVVCALTTLHTTDLQPIPGRVPAGAKVLVAGALGEGLSNPRIFVTRPSGEVEELPLSGPRLLAEVPLREKGEHSIEVLVESAQGPQVAALRRVFAGVAPPVSPPEMPQGATGLDGVEAQIAALRAAHGLPEVARDPLLDAVAEGHSVEMARTKTFAHVLPSDGSLGDRLVKRGYAYRTAGENIGLSDDALSAHEAIATSPAHLANLLDPRHSRLGLGMAKGPSPDGGEGTYLTEVLAAPIVGSQNPAREVSDDLSREREKRGLPPLQRDATLDSIATHEAQSAALRDAPQLDKGVPGKAIAQLPGLEAAVGELYVASAADEVTASKNLADARWTRLGVGAIYASSKQFGPGRLWVVLLYAR